MTTEIKIEAFAFVEGGTEKLVLNKLASHLEFKYPKIGRGKDSIKKAFEIIGPSLGGPFRCLIMRDIDYGEDAQTIVEEYGKLLKKGATGTGGRIDLSSFTEVFTRMSGYESIYTFEYKESTRIAVHFSDGSNHKYTHFCNKTTDDYFLFLLDQPISWKGFYQELLERGEGRPNFSWPETTNDESLRALSTRIIKLLEDRDLPNHIEAKMYLNVYELMARENMDKEETDEKPRGIRKMILKGADDKELKETFASLMEAIKFLEK